MNEKIFEQLEEKYNKMQNTCQLYIDLYKKKSVKQCFNKGYLLDILPFEHELHGYKLHKKPLEKMVMEDNYFVYHFNAEDKVCLVEEGCTFLKRIDDYTLYDYHEDYLYKYELQKFDVINVNKYFIENGKIIEGYKYAKFGHSYEQYVYVGERLEK